MKPHTWDHSPGTLPGPHNGVGPCGIGKFVLANASSVLSRRSAIDLTSFSPIPRFLESCLLIWSGHHGKVGFTIAWYPSERGT